MNNKNQKITIMVIDDTPANLGVLEEMLYRQGFEVISFPSGELALKTAVREHPGLILLDIMMPEMDGFEVCRRLKADPKTEDIPVIFISGLDDTSSKVKAFSEGGVDYVTKPFQEEEVISRVNTHLKLIGLQQELKAYNENLEQLVKQRTRELEQAHERLIEVNRLKNDFFNMIFHEIRTPASGILGVGELLAEQLSDSEDDQMLRDLFSGSSDRLRNLIDDATMITHLENLTDKKNIVFSFADLFDDVRKAFPEKQISLEGLPLFEGLFLRADCILIKKAMLTIVLLAECFSKIKGTVVVNGAIDNGQLGLHIDLDSLMIPEEQTERFFDLESPVRQSSYAETLALAPVVAHRILRAFGGDLCLSKKQENTGYLKASFRLADTRFQEEVT